MCNWNGLISGNVVSLFDTSTKKGKHKVDSPLMEEEVTARQSWEEWDGTAVMEQLAELMENGTVLK